MEDKFWLYNPLVLCQNFTLIPFKNLTFEQQLNAITRCLIIFFIITVLLDIPNTFLFFIISLIVIIIVFYIQRKMNRQMKNGNKENFDYTPTDVRKLTKTSIITKDGVEYVNTQFSGTEPRLFCNDEVSIDPPSEFAVSVNQRLANNYSGNSDYGNSNYSNGNNNTNQPGLPLTRISPIVTPPIYALDYWKDNDLIYFSQINTQGSQQDMYLSGYAESTCCDYLPPNSELVPKTEPVVNTVIGGDLSGNPNRNSNSIENYCNRRITSPIPAQDRVIIPIEETKEKYCNGRITSPIPAQDRVIIPVINKPKIERYAEYTTIEDPTEIYVQKNQPGWVNEQCGYNPQQIYTAGLPSNYPAGNCEQDPHMKRYNENLFTQTVTPGVYTRNQINEPINSNIGISFQQQFEPVTCNRDEKGLLYTQHDPRVIEPVTHTATEVDSIADTDRPKYDNVYDPRFYGYGTSYRSYLEPVTGQTRFYYDDINAIRMPNYVARSKIDFLPYADTYEPMKQNSEFGNNLTSNIRTLAQDSWLRNSLEFRNDLTERRMRKINSEAWQKRMAPLGPSQKISRGGRYVH